MSSWMVRRARAAWLLGFALALVGLLPVLLFALLSLLPGAQASAPLLGLLPEFSAPWLAETKLGALLRKASAIPASLHGAFLLALAGVGVMALGKWLADRQAPVFEAARLRREDALRRVRYYRDGSRIEPSMGLDGLTGDRNP
jgi:hypothetical protein